VLLVTDSWPTWIRAALQRPVAHGSQSKACVERSSAQQSTEWFRSQLSPEMSDVLAEMQDTVYWMLKSSYRLLKSWSNDFGRNHDPAWNVWSHLIVLGIKKNRLTLNYGIEQLFLDKLKLSRKCLTNLIMLSCSIISTKVEVQSCSHVRTAIVAKFGSVNIA
jgi:hypothetical protein